MTGKRLEKMKAALPSRGNRKNPWDKITSKQKAQRSFSIPRNQRKQGSSTTKMVRQQEETTNNTNKCSDSSIDTSTADSKTTIESDLLSNVEWGTDDDEWETSQSVEQMRSSDILSLDEVTIAPPMQFRDSEFFPHLDGGPIASTPLSLSKQTSLHFEENIESIKKDVPYTIRNEPQQHLEDLDIPDVSYIRECDDENDTLKDVNYHLKSISPEQSIQIPPVPEEINKDSQERITDSDTFFEDICFDGFEFSDAEDVEKNFDAEDVEKNFDAEDVEKNFDAEDVEKNFDAEDVEQNFDAEDVEQNFDAEDVEQNLDAEVVEQNSYDEDVEHNFYEVNINQDFEEEEDKNTIQKRIRKDYHKGRKHGDMSDMCNSFEDLDNQNSEDILVDNRNIQTDTPKKKGKLYRGVGMKSNSRMGRLLKRKIEENSFEDMNKSNNQNSFQNVQNIEHEELRVSDFDNNQEETAAPQGKCNKRVRVACKTQQDDVSKSKRPQIFTASKSKYSIVCRISFEDMNSSDNNNSFENAQNIRDKEAGMEELQNNPTETSTYQAENQTNKCVRVGNNKHPDVGGNRNRSQNVTTLKRNMIEERNSLDDMNDSDNEDRFETVQNIQNAELQVDELDKNQPETASQRKDRKFFKHPRLDSKPKQDSRIKKGSQNSSQRRKLKSKVKNSSEDIYAYNSEDSFEEGQNTQTGAVKKPRKTQRGVGIKRSSLGRKSRNVTKSFSSSQNSKDMEVFEDNHNIQNEGKKLEWPLCCLSNIKNKKIKVLKPVIRDDLPIDIITLMCVEKKSKGECMH